MVHSFEPLLYSGSVWRIGVVSQTPFYLLLCTELSIRMRSVVEVDSELDNLMDDPVGPQPTGIVIQSVIETAKRFLNLLRTI